MIKAGIIDPAKVVKTALLAAASTAGIMITTGCVMSEIPEEKPAPGSQMYIKKPTCELYPKKCTGIKNTPGLVHVSRFNKCSRYCTGGIFFKHH
jgi:hypothetical protein